MKASITFDNTYNQLPEIFHSSSQPDTPPNPQLVIFNENLATHLNLNLKDQGEVTKIFSGQSIPTGAEPIAMAYSGHQFGYFAPRLGDGRALLLGEVLNEDNQRFDIHLKGSGRTKFSRGGDGKAALGPALREYLISEAMHNLNVPTTRALAVTTTGESIQREKVLPGAIITRVSTSLIRVGTFEYLARHGDIKNLKILLDYTIKRNFPEITESSNKPFELLKKCIKRQSKLTAKWMSFGFIHGVMNTDNSSITGLTIDYGPCAFMDHFEHSRVFSSIDQNGRYSYSNQPSMTQWNLTRFAECLLPLYEDDQQKTALENFKSAIDEFSYIFSADWLQQFGLKLGLQKTKDSDAELISLWLDYLQNNKLDFTNSFLNLVDSISKPSKNFKPCSEFSSFYNKWKKRMEKESSADVLKTMKSANPLYIPRNHLVEEVINQAYIGNFEPFHQFNKVLSTPFTEQEIESKYSQAPHPEEVVAATFCGT